MGCNHVKYCFFNKQVDKFLAFFERLVIPYRNELFYFCLKICKLLNCPEALAFLYFLLFGQKFLLWGFQLVMSTSEFLQPGGCFIFCDNTLLDLQTNSYQFIKNCFLLKINLSQLGCDAFKKPCLLLRLLSNPAFVDVAFRSLAA